VIYNTGTPFNYSVISGEREGERRVVDTYRKQSKKVYYKILRDKLSRMSDDKNERERKRDRERKWVRDERTRVEWRIF